MTDHNENAAASEGTLGSVNQAGSTPAPVAAAPTPETDKVDDDRAPDKNGHKGWQAGYFAMLHHAKWMERQRNEARAELAAAKADITSLYNSLNGEARARIEGETALAAANAELAEFEQVAWIDKQGRTISQKELDACKGEWAWAREVWRGTTPLYARKGASDETE